MRQEEPELLPRVDCSAAGRLMPGSTHVTSPQSLLLLHCAEHLPRREATAMMSKLCRNMIHVLSCACSIRPSVLVNKHHCESRTVYCTVGAGVMHEDRAAYVHVATQELDEMSSV